MEIIYVFFGWLLGLFGTLIIDFFRERKQRKVFFASAVTELEDLKFILANVAFLLQLKHGRVTVELVKQTAEVTDNYSGNEPAAELKSILNKFRTLTQKEWDHVISQMRQNADTGSSLKLLKPRYVTEHLDALSKLSPEIQLRFYELLRTLDAINEEIPKIDYLVTMTFDSSISEENHSRIRDDLQGRQLFVAKQCTKALNKIDQISRAGRDL